MKNLLKYLYNNNKKLVFLTNKTYKKQISTNFKFKNNLSNNNISYNKKNKLFIINKFFSSKIPLILGDLGEGTKEAEIKQWYVKEGDLIEEEDKVVEVGTDKLVADIPSPVTGKIVKLNYDISQICLVGKSLCEIEASNVDNPEEFIEENSNIITDPKIQIEDFKDNNFEDKNNHNSNPEELDVPFEKFLATPAVRHIIKSKKLDASKIKPTGKNGRILKEDVLLYISNNTNINKIETSVTNNETNKEKSLKNKSDVNLANQINSEDKLVKIAGFKKAMTKSMTLSNSIPSFLYSDEYNVDNLIKIREDVNFTYKKELKFSYMPFIIKAVSNSLKYYPELNSIINPSVNEDGLIYEYIIKGKHNISIAIDGPEGLVVPNIKDVAKKSIKEIQEDLLSLRDKTYNKKLSSSDLTGGTFSISNIGNIGGKQLGPVIMSPQTCIIGISRMIDAIKIVDKDKLNHFEDIDYLGNNSHLGKYAEYKNSNISMFKDNEKKGVIFHKAINFCISADHRVIDGASIAKFSEKLKSYIENPMKILI